MHISEKEISLFLDNLLDSGRCKKLEKHFSVCKKCRDKLSEWQNLYSFLGQLQPDSELDGLENKIMQRIKSMPAENHIRQETPNVPLPALLYISFVAFILNLLFEPVINFINKFYNNTMAFMLDEGLEFINAAKWEAVDAIAMLRSMEMTGMAACVILIAGGIYFAVNRKSVRKV